MENENAPHGMRDKIGEWGFEKLKDTMQTFVTSACDVIGAVSSSRLTWADDDSIQIIKVLLSTGCDRSMKGILFVGFYRDNELTDDGPLMVCKRSLDQRRNDRVSDIEVSNLTRSSIDRLVVGMIGMPLSLAEQLGELIYAKTLGNAFFSIRLLQHLHSANLGRHSDSNQRGWEWNADKIRYEVDMGDNVLDFITQTINRCHQLLQKP
jgi:predicted ATPase